MTTETRSLLYDIGGGVASALLVSCVNELVPASERETGIDRPSVVMGIVSSLFSLYLRDYVFATPRDRSLQNRVSFWSTYAAVNTVLGRRIDSDYSFVLGQSVGRIVYRIVFTARRSLGE